MKIIIGIALVWAALSIAQSPSHKGTPKKYATANTDPAHNPDGARGSAKDAPYSIGGQIIEASREDKARESADDIEIQRKLADFTKYLVWVGGVQAVILAGTLLLIKRQATLMKTHAEHFERLAGATASQADLMDRQLAQMQAAGTHTEQLAQQAIRQSDLTQRQFDLANRPWISIDFVKAASNLEFRDNGDVLVYFIYQIKNVGHSVAQHISPWIEPIITAVDSPVEARTRISEQLKKPIDSYFDHGKLIFPNQVITDRYPVMIRPEKLAQALDKSPFKDRDQGVIRAIGLEIFVCFDYQSTVDPSKHHQTQSMYLLSYRGNGMFLPSQRFYGMDGLGLVFKGFGAYAD